MVTVPCLPEIFYGLSVFFTYEEIQAMFLFMKTHPPLNTNNQYTGTASPIFCLNSKTAHLIWCDLIAYSYGSQHIAQVGKELRAVLSIDTKQLHLLHCNHPSTEDKSTQYRLSHWHGCTGQSTCKLLLKGLLCAHTLASTVWITSSLSSTLVTNLARRWRDSLNFFLYGQVPTPPHPLTEIVPFF